MAYALPLQEATYMFNGAAVLAILLTTMLIILPLLSAPTQINQRFRRWQAEILATVGVTVVALILASSAVARPKGNWRVILQFMFNGWPNQAETLSDRALFAGVFLQAVFSLGLPILLASTIYGALTRSTTMRTYTYINRRDQFIASQIYKTFRTHLGATAKESLSAEQLDAICLTLANSVIENTKEMWDKNLPERTAHSLRDDTVVVEEQTRVR
jgi:hypothetical protein